MLIEFYMKRTQWKTTRWLHTCGCGCGLISILWTVINTGLISQTLQTHPSLWDIICKSMINKSMHFQQARVVCKQLGFQDSHKIFKDSYYGSVPRPFSYTNLQCTGNEERLEDCPRLGSGPGCDSGSGAGVYCIPHSPPEGKLICFCSLCYFSLFTSVFILFYQLFCLKLLDASS